MQPPNPVRDDRFHAHNQVTMTVFMPCLCRHRISGKERTMDLVSFYQNVLSLIAPWYVDRVECHPDAKRGDLWL